ncbi:MAG: TIGR00375 family protein [Candidatus Hadarchaeales archaeon]
MELNIHSVDFHIHGRYSGATSSRMVISEIARQARLKGLAIVGTGDALHKKWLESIKEELVETADGTYEHPKWGTRFILTAEVEDQHRVHHLLLIPSIAVAEDLREELKNRSPDIDADGRAHFDLDAPELVDVAIAHGCLIGPCHAFTPWTSMYKEFDSIWDCYGDRARDVRFIELGLSADTYMADRIKELANLTFLSNSDAHSPWPDKLGREFNRLALAEKTFDEIAKAIERKDGRAVVLNVGFDPRLGKYYRSACSKCFKQFELTEAKALNWRCDRCGGSIKKGVFDRVNELADYPEPRHPPHRPNYLRIAPLAEVLALAFGHLDAHDSQVQELWGKLLSRFGDEIKVLVDVPVDDIANVAGRRVAAVIKAFREQKLHVVPGGGGRYGYLEMLPDFVRVQEDRQQRTLMEFG